ncbi:MAG: hypothetical protein ACRYFS_05335 [Janthinobacterium lividum]
MTMIATQYDATTLLMLPRVERNRILALAAEAAAPEYEADLARPVAERELTAFTALDGEPFLEDSAETIMEDTHATEFHQPKAR